MGGLKNTNLMKKTYIQPQLRSNEVEIDNLMDGSVVGSNGIENGGVDTTGEKDPDANYNNIWDDSYEIRRNRVFFDDFEE